MVIARAVTWGKQYIDKFVLMVLLALIQLAYSGYGVLLKLWAQDVDLDPILLVYIRTTCACLLASAVAVWTEGPPGDNLQWPHIKWDLLRLLILAFGGIILSPILYMYGIYGTSPLFAALISQLTPIVCIFVGILLKQEPIPNPYMKLGACRILGFFLGLSGATFDIIMTILAQKQKQNVSIGVIALILEVFVAVLYMILQRKFFSNNHSSPWRTRPLTAHATMFMLASIFGAPALPYSLLSGSFYRMLDVRALVPMLYATFVNAFLCALLFNWCNHRSNSSTVAASFSLQVVFSALLSATVLGETLVWYQGLSAVCILSGLLLIIITMPTGSGRETLEAVVQKTDQSTDSSWTGLDQSVLPYS